MGIVVGNSFWFDFEVTFMEWLQRVLGENGIRIISLFSMFGEELILVAVLGFLYWCYDKEMGKAVGTSIVLGLVMVPMIKNVFWRRRPYFDHENIKCYRPVEKHADIYDIAAQGFSFPSNHSANAVSVFSAIAVQGKKKILTVIAIIIPVLVGLSRVSVGVHYPTDVLCGWAMGGLCVLISTYITEKIPEEKKWIIYLVIFCLSCTGLLYCKTSDYFAALGMMGGMFSAFEFEKRFVRFKGTKNPLWCVVRIGLGVVIYIILNTVLKLPFSKEFLNSGTFAARIVRMVRYYIIIFGTIGIYPYAFKLLGTKTDD